MFNRFGAGLAIMAAAGMLLVVACSDDEETTTPTTTTQPQGGNGGSGTGGSGGSTGMTCDEACAAAYVCGQAECPRWDEVDITEELWLDGTEGDNGCLAGCAALPALTGLVAAYESDCAAMVTALAGADPDFDESCNGTGGSGGSGGAAGGAGGAEGGAGGAAGGAGGAGGGN